MWKPFLRLLSETLVEAGAGRGGSRMGGHRQLETRISTGATRVAKRREIGSNRMNGRHQSFGRNPFQRERTDFLCFDDHRRSQFVILGRRPSIVEPRRRRRRRHDCHVVKTVENQIRCVARLTVREKGDHGVLRLTSASLSPLPVGASAFPSTQAILF